MPLLFPFNTIYNLFICYPKTIAAAIALPIDIPPAAASSKAGGLPAPVDVKICPSDPVAIATGSPLASKLIMFPSVPPASFANVIALS